MKYGEIIYSTLQKAILWIERTHNTKINGTFFDVGHGAGKGVIAAALTGRFTKVGGVELLPGLFFESVKLRDTFLQRNTAPEFELIEGDFLEQTQWVGADLVYMNSVFDGGFLLEQISEEAAKMKVGAWFLTTFKPLLNPDGRWEIKHEEEVDMSWGRITMYFHLKVK